MGSSESGGGLADSGAGSIVWVRRRNGSWWPGKILGPDELSASHVMSPRSGTPVKLLGREDASVDWYNLEKSKRVKPFRCSDFDDCIEKAEASLGMPAKKREKYARREDAILHALELEKHFLDRKYANLGTASNSRYPTSPDSRTKVLATSSGTLEDGSGSSGKFEFRGGHNKLGSSTENECSSIPLFMNRGGEYLTLEQDSSEVNPPKSVLQDYGRRKASSKMMNSPFPASNGLHKTTDDLQVLAPSDGGPFLGKHYDVDSTKFIKKKKKRHPEVSFEDSITKRCDRRRPLAQVMEYSTKLTGGEHTAHHSRVKKREVSSRTSEETESDSSGTDSMERAMDPSLTAFSGNSDARVNSRVPPNNRLALRGQHASSSSEEDDASSPDDPSQYCFHDPVSVSAEVSKWQLKGKRNVRQLPKRSVYGFSHPMYLERIRGSVSQRSRGPGLSYYHDSDDLTNEVDLVDNDVVHHQEGFHGRRYLQNFEAASKRQSIPRQRLIEWEEPTLRDRSFKGYIDGRGSFFNLRYMSHPRHDMLIDAELKVQAKQTRGEHVPWVSLMSKPNGMAIVGHPIQIEILEDGSTDILLSAGGVSSSLGYDVRSRGPSVWEPDRRTANSRAPHPHLSAMLEDDGYCYSDQYRTPQFKKPGGGGGSTNKKMTQKRTLSHIPKPLQQRIKKQHNITSSSASKKTRTLSSMGMNRRNGEDCFMDEVIKDLAFGPPVVACIPVKLVFSRLLEAVGRPPSGPIALGVSVNSNKERKTL